MSSPECAIRVTEGLDCLSMASLLEKRSADEAQCGSGFGTRVLDQSQKARLEPHVRSRKQGLVLVDDGVFQDCHAKVSLDTCLQNDVLRTDCVAPGLVQRASRVVEIPIQAEGDTFSL